MSHTTDDRARLGLRESATFDRQTIAAIHRAAETGIYDIRGWGAKRPLPHFDDLLFLGASMSRYPLEGYRERCDTDVVLGDRHAKHPLHLDIPVTIAGMCFGALSGPAKEALGRGASEVGTSTTTGDGGMTPEERGQSKYLVYQYLPSRYGMNPDDLRKADAIEVVLGQGAKPGGGGMLLGQKISATRRGDAHAARRHRPAVGVPTPGLDRTRRPDHQDQRTARDHRLGEADLRQGRRDPHLLRRETGRACGRGRRRRRRHAGRHRGHPGGLHRACRHPDAGGRPRGRAALQELDVHRKVQLIVSGGIRTGADVAKAIALGADAVAIGTAALIALGDNHPRHESEYEKLGSAAGFFDDFQDGTDPAGISTQDPELAARFDPVEGGRRLANYLRVLTMEAQTIARACGKAHVLHLEPEDLVAVTIEAAAMARVPLAGTDWIPGARKR